MTSTALQAAMWWTGLGLLAALLGLYILWLGKRTADGGYDDPELMDSTMHLHLHEDIRRLESSMNAAESLFDGIHSLDQMKCDVEKAAAFGWTRWFEMKRRIKNLERRIEILEEGQKGREQKC